MYSLKELNVDFYSDINCFYCNKAKEMFKKEGVIEFFNIKETEPLPKNVEGVPYFFSNTTKRSQLGCPTSVDNLIKKLNGEGIVRENDNSVNDDNNNGTMLGLSITLAVLFLIFIIYLFYNYKK